ncbi:odorant receptor 43a-like [Vespa mandarinia]|uniref:odorant receptor 43a-like n=1 Tax=Vespa mandarinia TaxID=7446 RepID=UPI0016135B09|nr:odorant receptor 43a-like [Vespa mandarinia]
MMITEDAHREQRQRLLRCLPFVDINAAEIVFDGAVIQLRIWGTAILLLIKNRECHCKCDKFGTLVSILMEIRLSCGSIDETLDFFGISLSTVGGLTKLIFIKLHRNDLRKILISALNNWSAIVDSSSARKIMLKYSQRGKFVGRMQMSFAFVIITAIILDAISSPEASQQENITSSEEFPKRIPLRTMCAFGNMSTSIYWTVFVLQSIQLFNAVLIESGNDVFFFGISMQICGQFDTLRILLEEFKMEKEEDRVPKIRQFIDKHSHLLDLARRVEDTFANVLLILLMTNGVHICLTGIQILLLSKQNDIVPLIKATVAFIVILIQIFLYSYAGDFLSSLTQDIYNVIYDYPWYELSPSNVRNLIFIIMRAHKPFRLRAGRFYPMDIESFKNILKASFSYFSVLRIVFEE